MATVKTLSRLLLRDGIKVRFTTRGFSMYPLISTGDMILVKPIPEPALGDLLVFVKNEEMFCHRLKKIYLDNGTTMFQTKGDNQFRPDEPMTAEDILGKVYKVDRCAVSKSRRILLACYPLSRYGYLNAAFVAAFMNVRRIFPRKG